MAVKVKIESISSFRFFTPEKANLVAPLTKIVEKQPGENIILEDSLVLGLYIILEGEAGIFTKGDKEALVTFGAGHEFGEMSLIENSKANVSVKALDKPVTLIFIPHESIKKLLESDFEAASYFYRGISHSLSQKLRRTTIDVFGEKQKEKELLGKVLKSSSLTESGSEEFFEKIDTLLNMKLSQIEDIASTLKLKFPNEPNCATLSELANDIASTDKRTIQTMARDIKKAIETIREISNASTLGVSISK